MVFRGKHHTIAGAARVRPRSSRGRTKVQVVGLAILGRVLALAAGILLLLTRLLAAALLLARLLTRVLILLSRILVLIGHLRSPLLNAVHSKRLACAMVSLVTEFHRDHCVAAP